MPETGDAIGPYRLISPLGKGAMGEVWRARDERLDRYVALKVIPPDLAGDVERRARMLREARAAAAIRHANVVTLFDVVAHAGDDILVMELVEGRTLSEALRKDGPPKLDVALAWIEGVADALVAAHGRGILHRDIKAANVMVTAEGGVKVLDFGLAKVRDGDPAFTAPSRPPPDAPIALDATIPSTRLQQPLADSSLDKTHDAINSYRTHAGQLLGTPLYMAPEQIGGGDPDERSEVFSVGVLAHEILAGKPPYTAGTLDELFAQIANMPPPALPDVPTSVSAIVARALAKDPEDRFPSMVAVRDAFAAVRKRRTIRRAPPIMIVLAALAIALVVGGIGGIAWYFATRHHDMPGDKEVARALEEYDLFYGDKAMSSLRAALAIAPDHPRANAYVLLFGGGSDADRNAALAGAKRAHPDGDKDRALLDAAIALGEQGPAQARAAIAASGADVDRELAFWTAELDYRSGKYAEAGGEYKALLAEPAPQFRGRIYDHDSSVLLYLDEPDEALRIGKLYRDAFPGEADAVGVYATTLAAAGRLPDAIAAAEDALRLNEGEDTLAGLAKVVALSGDRARAEELYQRSLNKAGPARRPLRRAALALLQWLDGDLATAKATVAPCLPRGADATARERGACLFVAGILDPQSDAAAQLDALAADPRPPYGAPASLAKLVRARAKFFGGACLTAPEGGTPDEAAYDAPLDFFAAYHVPFFATWAVCEKAAARAAKGDKDGAAALLRPVANKAPGRTWLLDALKRY